MTVTTRHPDLWWSSLALAAYPRRLRIPRAGDPIVRFLARRSGPGLLCATIAYGLEGR